MVLPLLGLIVIVIFTIFVARTAGENGRNGLLWGGACAFVGFALQWIIPITFWLAVGIVLTVSGMPQVEVMRFADDWALLVTVVFFALSLASMFLILRKAAEIPEDNEVQTDEIPPPPSFEP